MAPLRPLHPPSAQDGGAMPGERPRGAPPPTMTGDLQPCQAASGLGRPLQHPHEDHSLAGRTTQGMREAGGRARAIDAPKAQRRQAKEVAPQAPLLRTQARSAPPGRAGGPRTPSERSRPQARLWLPSRVDSSPPQLYSLSITNLRVKPTLDETPEGPLCEASQDPEAEVPQGQGTGAHLRPSLPRAEALSAPKVLGSQRCFQEAPSSLTSTNHTSPTTTPGPPPLRAPQSSGASPNGPGSYPEFQASGADPWPPAAENFPGANLRVSPTEPEPFPEGSRPGSPRGTPFPYPFPAQAPPGASTQPFPADTAGHTYAGGALVFAFHQPPGTWPEAALGAGPAYPLPSRPGPPPLPCFPSQPGSLEAPSDPGGTLSPTGTAHSAPSPFPESLHKSLTKVLPEGPSSAHDGMGSPRGPPNPLSQRHFAGQTYGANGVGSSPGPMDTELATPGPPPAGLPQLWDPTAAPYPTPALGPPGAARTAFFENQRLCLPQSPPTAWPQVPPTPGPSPHRIEVLSQLPFPGGAPEWPGGSQGALSAVGKTPGPGETLGVVRGSPSQQGSSPGLFPYSGLKDPMPQPLFFGGTQPQVSPRGVPGLPPPRVVGASPSESPLPSPATNTTGSSSCSSLSPLSSSPANPSSEDSQLPGPLGPPGFFHPPTHSQETGSPFPSPEASHTLPTHYQPERAKVFPFSVDGLGAEGAFEGLDEAPFPSKGPGPDRGGLQDFPREPPPYSAHHFPLSSASLDQLDVLLTCRQCDRNYGSLAAFLAHRHFCRPARAGDGPQQPPAPATTPKAPAHAHPGSLGHSNTAPFLLTGDVQADGKDDPLRTGFLPGLAASDLDMEDDAKLDSLITEALNGMEYQSDNPEIDSSFIDVFADEEPTISREPSTGQPPNTRLGLTPEQSTPSPLLAGAAMPEPADGGCPPRNRPQTRSLGLAPTEADTTSLVRQQRRGKQVKLFRKELDGASSTKGLCRVPCLRPRRGRHSAERPPPRTQDFRTQTKGPADPDGGVSRDTSLPTETRSSKRLRLPPRKDPRKRRARGGTWSKELIHKIVQQKNKLYRWQGPHGPLMTGRPPSAEWDCASESEEDEGPRQQGPSFRGRPRPGRRRWHRGEKKGEDLTQGPRKPGKQEAGGDRDSPSPGGPCNPSQSLGAGEAPVEGDPKCADHPTAAPKHSPQVPANTKTPEENHPSSGFPQEVRKSEGAEQLPPDATKPSSSPAVCVSKSPRSPAPEPAEPGRDDSGRPQPPRSAPAPGGGGPLSTPKCTKPPRPHATEGSPAHQPGDSLAPVASAAEAACPNPVMLFLKNSDLSGGSVHFNRDPVGAPAATEEPQPSGRAPNELFLKPKDLEGCFPADLCSKPLAVDTPVSSSHLSQDGVGALGPAPPKNPPYAAETDPGKAQSPLTLESTSLFSGLPEDGFDPPLYDSLSASRDTHVPLACADPPPKKPLMNPPYPPFVLLEEVSPMLPGQFPDLSKGKTFSKKCPQEGTVPPSPPPVPGKRSECSVTFMSNLSEDELEIKRLVTELESQLQSKEGSRGAPGELGEAAGGDRRGPGPSTEPASAPPSLLATPPRCDTLSAADLTGLGGSSPHPEGIETAVATREGALGTPQQEWPCPAPSCPAEVAPPHGDPAIRFQTVQKARVAKTEGDSGVPPDLFLPDPDEQRGPLRETVCPAKYGPNYELSFPKISKDVPPLLPCEQGAGCSPEPLGTQGPCPVSPACLSPDLGFQADGDAPLDAILPPGACHRAASEGHSEGRGPERTGLLHPRTEGAALEGDDFAPAGASPLAAFLGGEAPLHPVPSPAWVPNASTGKRPQGPTAGSLCPLQAPGAGAEKADIWSSQEPLPTVTQGPQHRDPLDPEGDRAERGSPTCVQMTAVPVVARHQLGPKADRHLGLPSQSEKPRGRGKAPRQSPGAPHKLSVRPEAHLARPATGTHRLEGSRAALGLWKRAQPSPGPTSPDDESLVSALPETHAQRGPQNRAPKEAAASPDLDPQPLFNTESPAPPIADLGPCTPSPTSMALPAPHGLEPPPQEHPPSTPGGLLLAPSSCRDPPSPLHLPSWSPAWVPPSGDSCAQAPTDAGAGEPPAVHTSLMTSHCGPPLLRASSPTDPPSCQGGLSHVSATTHPGYSPEGSTLRTLEDSRKEGPRESPTCASCPPPGGHNPPRVTTQAASPPSIPTEDDRAAARGIWAPDPHCRGAPPHTGPDRESKGPLSAPPVSTRCLGRGDGKIVTAVPMDPAALGASGPDPHACLEGEMGASGEAQGDAGTPEARHHGVTEALGAGTQGPATIWPTTGLCPSLTTSPSSTARDLRSDSPQSHISVSPKKDPRQRPRGFKKKSEPTEKGHRKGRALAGLPVTCEVCSASFRSRPGLSRHKARKHRPPRATTPQPSPTADPTHQPLEPTTQSCQAPGKERASQLLPSHASGLPPVQGSMAPKDTLGPETQEESRREVRREPGMPGSPLHQQVQPPGLMEQGEAVRASASQPGGPDQLEADQLHPKGTERGESQRRSREPTASPSNSEGKSSTRVGKPGARRVRAAGAPRGPGVTSNQSPSAAIASDTAPLSRCLLPEGELEASGPGMLEDAADTAPGALSAEEMAAPRDRRIHGGRMQRASLGRKGAWKRRSGGPRETRALAVCKEPSQAAGSEPTEECRGARGGSGQGVRERTPDPAEMSGSEAGSTISGCPQSFPEAPGLGDPASLFDDEVSFSRLFPLGGRFTRKKNPHVYGKRGKRPKRPPPAPPSGKVAASPPSTRLPTDLSDSGSLCLSPEDPWGDEDMGLPESFLLDGLLDSRVPGIDPWAPSLGLWALEPAREAGHGEEAPSCCAEDDRSEAIPKLHMVPAAWRGLGLRAPTEETCSSLGDVSPEPPDLERERYDGGLPGNSGLLPLHTEDFEMLGTKLEMQDLCFLGPCDDLAGLPSTSLLDFKATTNSQGPRSKRTEEAVRVGQARGREQPTQGRKASYKCRVCFQRFRGLGELDLHKLAHSPSPPPTCYMCVERRFGSRQLLQEHLQEKHGQGRAGPWACGMCLKEVADVWMYNQHLREHATRFARRGQARQCLGDLPECLEGDSAITLFLNSIMEPATKPHRARHAVDRASGSPGEALEREREARNETPQERAKPRTHAASSIPDGSLPPSGSASSSPAAPTSSSTAGTVSNKVSPSPSPEPWSHGEPLLQAIPVHGDCRDPSRDCHHCGKRFPKPFKLQRHLAVHSPQRVYLCPRCPRVYPEHGELREHLSRAHGVEEERELPHTPLYACELCANVMHVIRRSFVCSSCNYTFVKKEQFDRHMDKHLRGGQQPFTLRSVRRPGAPGRKAPAPESTLPNKRRKVAIPSSAPVPCVDRPLSPSSPALPQICPEVAPSTTQGWPKTQERLVDPESHPVRRDNPPSDGLALLPPSLSPFPVALADGEGGSRLDRALERPENEALSGSPGPCEQQAPPGGKRASRLFSGKRRTSGTSGKCAPAHSSGDPSPLQREKQASPCHAEPAGGTGAPSHKSSAAKPGACPGSSKDKSAGSIPSRPPKLPAQPKKPLGVRSPAPGELARGTEDRAKPTGPKAKSRPGSQGSGGPRPNTKIGGGSQPQPASGRLQSEIATTPAKPARPGPSPTPDKPLPRAQARGSSKGPREAGDQGPRGCPGPRETGENNEKRRKGQAPGLTRRESMGSLGRIPLAPDKPPRAPRKQATPSRVLPAKPRPSSQNSKMGLQPSEQRKGEPSHAHRKEAPGKAFPQERPLLRSPKRGRAVHGAEAAEPRDYRTAESQSDLLSQLFGQRLTSFKIPLKKDSSE